MIANSGQDLIFGQFFIRHLKSATLTLFGAGIVLGASVTAALAQPATCDPLYWDSIKAKAWTEAEREIEQNQNLIYKADSVLEYTCFDQFSRTLAGHSDQLFSGTLQWGPIVGPDMAAALTNLLAGTMINYINNNFAHRYLGDRSTQDYAIGSFGTNGSHYNYNCDQIGRIWQTAKCLDFANSSTSDDKVDTSSHDDFFYLSTYATNDYRRLTAACTLSGNWPTQTSLANNDAQQYPKETFNVYDNFFNSTACNSVPPIPTGVQVVRTGSTNTYDEMVCVNPGCAYNAAGACSNNP